MRLIDADAIQFENNEFDTYSDYSRAFDAIDQAETIEERQQGKWYEKPWGYECSKCHGRPQFHPNGKDWLSDYCPNCGAKMDL